MGLTSVSDDHMYVTPPLNGGQSAASHANNNNSAIMYRSANAKVVRSNLVQPPAPQGQQKYVPQAPYSPGASGMFGEKRGDNASPNEKQEAMRAGMPNNQRSIYPSMQGYSNEQAAYNSQTGPGGNNLSDSIIDSVGRVAFYPKQIFSAKRPTKISLEKTVLFNPHERGDKPLVIHFGEAELRDAINESFRKEYGFHVSNFTTELHRFGSKQALRILPEIVTISARTNYPGEMGIRLKHTKGLNNTYVNGKSLFMTVGPDADPLVEHTHQVDASKCFDDPMFGYLAGEPIQHMIKGSYHIIKNNGTDETGRPLQDYALVKADSVLFRLAGHVDGSSDFRTMCDRMSTTDRSEIKMSTDKLESIKNYFVKRWEGVVADANLDRGLKIEIMRLPMVKDEVQAGSSVRGGSPVQAGPSNISWDHQEIEGQSFLKNSYVKLRLNASVVPLASKETSGGVAIQIKEPGQKQCDFF